MSKTSDFLERVQRGEMGLLNDQPIYYEEPMTDCQNCEREIEIVHQLGVLQFCSIDCIEEFKNQSLCCGADLGDERICPECKEHC